MIQRSKQNWSIGETVKVGFMSLIVRAAIPTPGDYAPDAYLLTNKAGDKAYKFVPHNGLVRLEEDEVDEILAQADRNAADVARLATERAALNAKARGHFNAAFAFDNEAERDQRFFEICAEIGV
jgi:hypothetical protein